MEEKEDYLQQYTAEQLLDAAERKIVVTAEASAISLICMEDVAEEDLKWLYCPYIPRGKVTLCSANPGSGKTWVMCYAVACVSTGKQFFDVTPFYSCPEKAIYITAEDGLGDTIKKRLRICGANMKNVYSVIDPKAELSFENPKLEEIIKEVRPALVVMDPIQAYIGANVGMNAANKTRPVMTRLAQLAEKYDVAIVLVCHINKNEKGSSITRTIGSMDIPGIARSMLAVGNVPNEEFQKYMSHEKSSNSQRGKTKLFHIDPDHGGIVIDGESDLSMDEYNSLRNSDHRKNTEIEAAKLFLLNNIPEGKRLASELRNLGEANGFSYDTLNRARKELNIRSDKDGFGGKCYWIKPTAPSDTE